ncbi:ribonuclease R [Oligella ureolytica]
MAAGDKRNFKDYEHSVWERLGVVLSAYERRADEASYDVQAWLMAGMHERVRSLVAGYNVTGIIT